MITVISGTNRPNSRTMQVAEYYHQLLKQKGEESQILDLAKLPHEFLFSALYENRRKNPEFNKFADIINKSEKFLFIVPEYNASFPGVLKGFIDGLDFPSGFNHKKAALVGISSGIMAGALALSHLTDILNYLGAHVHPIKPRLPRVDKLIVDGKITDQFLSDLVNTQAQALIDF